MVLAACKKRRLVLILLLCLFLGACSRPVILRSPDGSMTLKADPGEHRGVVLSIYDGAGKLMHSENTRASDVQGWTVRWVDNSTILLDSSDIGYMRWRRQADGSWRRNDPLRHPSPDGKWVLYTYWNSLRPRTVTIDVLEGTSNPDEAHTVFADIPTNHPVTNLIDCV